MKNLFMFSTASGKTQLREYMKVALGLFVILVALFIVNFYNRDQMVSVVMATPRPLETSQLPAVTEQISTPVTSAEECPSDTVDWTLTENTSVPGSNLKELFPQCVKDHLDRTVSWLYATYVLGYSRMSAAQLLGFSDLPISYSFGIAQIAVVTDFGDDPQMVDLGFPSNNTGLAEWRIDENGEPAVEFSFSGCFRTSSLTGGDVVSWGEGYPILCQYSGDFQTRHYVGDVNGKVVTASGSENVRRFMWFGYAGDGKWVFLGFAKDWEYDLSQIQGRNVFTMTPAVMAEKFTFDALPLPENWAAFTGQEYEDAFLEELRESN